MSFADIFNLMYNAIDQDPMSFMVVYPMTLMTSSVLLYALVQDLIPTTKAKIAHATVKPVASKLAAVAVKSQYETGSRVRFSN